MSLDQDFSNNLSFKEHEHQEVKLPVELMCLFVMPRTLEKLKGHIADFTALLYFYGILSGLKSHGLVSHDYISQST